jgi:hypothetical protein
LKSRLKVIASVGWSLLTEIPGWPDAPTSLRVRRALPIVAPFFALVVLVGWTQFIREPRMRAEQEADRPVLALEEEVSSLRLRCSDQQARELMATTTEASLLLIEEPELRSILRSLKQHAADRGWNATFQTADRSTEPAPEGSQILYLPARGKLAAKANSPQVFSNFLAFIEQLNASPKRIDLTRLAIRADEQGGYTSEISFRMVSRASAHEKTP